MKRITTVLFFALLSTTLFAQTDKMREQAILLADKMNAEIISENPALALTEAQKTQISEIIAQRSQAFTNASKTEKDEELRKEAQKAAVKPFNQKIFTEILSKEQKLALDTARKKLKNEK